MNNKQSGPIFTEETIKDLQALVEVLFKIHTRMKREGYAIINGQIVHQETGEVWIQKHSRKK